VSRQFPVYRVCSADEVIETSNELEGLVVQLLQDWDLGDEDLAVWREETEEDGPRLVAVLRAGPDGKAQVTWL